MKSISIPVIAVAVVLAVSGDRAVSAQDKYTLKVPDGLAFSEFRGYEDWQVVAVSKTDDLMSAILANPVMIDAYRAGVPGNGQPFPDGAKIAKIHWKPKDSEERPLRRWCRTPWRRRLHGKGQQEIFGHRQLGVRRIRL